MRMIPAMFMVQGGDQGLVLSPRAASVQVIVVPCGITAKTVIEQRTKINGTYEELSKTLIRRVLVSALTLTELYA